MEQPFSKIWDNVYIVYGSIFALFVVNYFAGNIILDYLVSYSAIIAFVISWFRASRLFRVIGLLFFVSGFIMNVYAGTPLYRIPLQTESTLPMLVFLCVLPWMNSAFHAGAYDKKISQLLQTKSPNLGSLYGKSLMTTYFLLVFINISAIFVAQNLLQEKLSNLKKQAKESFMVHTTVRAFALAVIWSPMEVIVAMTIDSTGISYVTFLPWLLLCSIIATFVDSYIGKRKFKHIAYDNTSEDLQTDSLWLDMAKLFIVLLLFLVAIIVISETIQMNFLMAVSLVIIPFAFIWTLSLGKVKPFLLLGWKSWVAHTNHMQNFVVLFLSLALFSNGFNATPFPSLLQYPLAAIADYPYLIFWFIFLVYFVMAMIGVHPIATIAILIEVLKPLFAVINPLSLGIVMIVSALATSTSGPYGIIVTMTSMNLETNPYRIAKRNMGFTLMVTFVGTIIAYFLL